MPAGLGLADCGLDCGGHCRARVASPGRKVPALDPRPTRIHIRGRDPNRTCALRAMRQQTARKSFQVLLQEMCGRISQRDAWQREAERARKFDRALAYRLQSEPRTCERCGCQFKPNYPQQRFCSRTCSGSRSVAEKMNGKPHPWNGKTGGNGVHPAAISSLNGGTPPASSAARNGRSAG